MSKTTKGLRSGATGQRRWDWERKTAKTQRPLSNAEMINPTQVFGWVHGLLFGPRAEPPLLFGPRVEPPLDIRQREKLLEWVLDSTVRIYGDEAKLLAQLKVLQLLEQVGCHLGRKSTHESLESGAAPRQLLGVSVLDELRQLRHASAGDVFKNADARTLRSAWSSATSEIIHRTSQRLEKQLETQIGGVLALIGDGLSCYVSPNPGRYRTVAAAYLALAHLHGITNTRECGFQTINLLAAMDLRAAAVTAGYSLLRLGKLEEECVLQMNDVLAKSSPDYQRVRKSVKLDLYDEVKMSDTGFNTVGVEVAVTGRIYQVSVEVGDVEAVIRDQSGLRAASFWKRSCIISMECTIKGGLVDAERGRLVGSSEVLGLKSDAEAELRSLADEAENVVAGDLKAREFTLCAEVYQEGAAYKNLLQRLQFADTYARIPVGNEVLSVKDLTVNALKLLVTEPWKLQMDGAQVIESRDSRSLIYHWAGLTGSDHQKYEAISTALRTGGLLGDLAAAAMASFFLLPRSWRRRLEFGLYHNREVRVIPDQASALGYTSSIEALLSSNRSQLRTRMAKYHERSQWPIWSRKISYVFAGWPDVKVMQELDSWLADGVPNQEQQEAPSSRITRGCEDEYVTEAKRDNTGARSKMAQVDLRIVRIPGRCSGLTWDEDLQRVGRAIGIHRLGALKLNQKYSRADLDTVAEEYESRGAATSLRWSVFTVEASNNSRAAWFSQEGQEQHLDWVTDSRVGTAKWISLSAWMWILRCANRVSILTRTSSEDQMRKGEDQMRKDEDQMRKGEAPVLN